MNGSPWEQAVYAAGKQVNRWPYTGVVATTMRHFGNRDRSQVRVLELGCGTGNNIRFLAEEGFSATGIDQSPTAIKLAEELLIGNGLSAELQTGDFSVLDFESESFDLVIDRAAIVHNCFRTMHTVVGEARRVLKPGGLLYSHGIKGAGHPEKHHGREVEPYSRDHFDNGKFRGVGITSFLDLDALNELFRDFSTFTWRCHRTSGPNDRLLDEEYEIEAVK